MEALIIAESGKTLGKRNVNLFQLFIQKRERSGDWDNFISPEGKRLLRKDISLACGFNRTAFVQNPTLRQKLKDIEEQLIKQGMLKSNSNIERNIEYRDQDEFIKKFRNELKELKNKMEETTMKLDKYNEYIERIKTSENELPYSDK